MLSIPLLIPRVLVALDRRPGRVDVRRYGAGYESSFVYHHAKRMVRPAIYIPCMLWPVMANRSISQSASCCRLLSSLYCGDGNHRLLQKYL
ncbi:DUF4400 domain-containing protein [Serratia ureilytica]